MAPEEVTDRDGSTRVVPERDDVVWADRVAMDWEAHAARGGQDDGDNCRTQKLVHLDWLPGVVGSIINRALSSSTAIAGSNHWTSGMRRSQPTKPLRPPSSHCRFALATSTERLRAHQSCHKALEGI